MSDKENKSSENDIKKDKAVPSADDKKDAKASGTFKPKFGEKKTDDTSELDKEIEELDEFLLEQEEDVIEDEDHVLTASKFKSADKNKGSGTKYAGYFAVVILLCGLLYAILMFVPSMFGDKETDNLQNILDNRAASNIVPLSMSDEVSVSEEVVSTPAPDLDPISMPEAIDTQDETIDVENNNNFVIDQSEPAPSIAEALAMAQNETVEEPEMVEIPLEEQDIMDIPAESAFDTMPSENEPITAMNDNPAFERTFATDELINQTENLQPLAEEQIEIANDVMNMPDEDLIDMVETVDEVVMQVDEVIEDEAMTPMAEQTIIQEAVKETIDILSEETNSSLNNQDVADTIIEEVEAELELIFEEAEVITDAQVQNLEIAVNTIEAESVQSDIAVITHEEPVVQKKNIEPQKLVEAPLSQAKPSKIKPSISEKPFKEDLEKAQTALNNRNYNDAYSLYQSILESDPANTGALTGIQIARANLDSPDAPQVRRSVFDQSLTSLNFTDDLRQSGSNLNNVVIETTDESRLLRDRLRQAEEGQMVKPLQSEVSQEVIIISDIPKPTVLNEGILNNENIILMDKMISDQNVFVQDIETPGAAAMDGPINEENLDIVAVASMPEIIEPVVTEPQPIADLSSLENTQGSFSDIENMLMQAETELDNAEIALRLANFYNSEGQNAEALNWYREALKRDSLHNAGLDRMKIYDLMVGVE
jgi:tetratricopeptide (TPR) repeat protein